MRKQLLAFLFAISTIFCFRTAFAGKWADDTISPTDSADAGCRKNSRTLMNLVAGRSRPPGLRLGKKGASSHLGYADLAQAIEKKFDELEDVEVLSIKNSLVNIIDRLMSMVVDDSDLAFRIKLHFKAKVDSLSQDFFCKMTISRFLRSDPDLTIFIRDCKNSQGIMLGDFNIRDLLRLNIRHIRPKN